jgi:hypothetical protein
VTKRGTAWNAHISYKFSLVNGSPPSLQPFEIYGQRFGGIEPHFKDYKSAGFDLIRSHLRHAEVLSRLLMLLAAATLIAISVELVVVSEGRRKWIDWHHQRGLSFLQLGLREIERLCYHSLPMPKLIHIPRRSPPTSYASLKSRDLLETRIKFSRVTVFAA